jgi:hypothetical protein
MSAEELIGDELLEKHGLKGAKLKKRKKYHGCLDRFWNFTQSSFIYKKKS